MRGDSELDFHLLSLIQVWVEANYMKTQSLKTLESVACVRFSSFFQKKYLVGYKSIC